MKEIKIQQGKVYLERYEDGRRGRGTIFVLLKPEKDRRLEHFGPDGGINVLTLFAREFLSLCDESKDMLKPFISKLKNGEVVEIVGVKYKKVKLLTKKKD